MHPVDNKYTHWYYALMQKRRNTPLLKVGGYCENHHVLPECLGGPNTKENMIMLSAREHYVAHLLLTKMFDGDAKKRMHYAFYSMRRKKAGMVRYEPNSHIYEILVKKIDRAPSEETRKRMRDSAKLRPPQTEETRQLRSAAVRASYTPELRASRSAQFKDKPFTDQHRRNLSAGQKGKVMSEAFIEYCRQRRGEKNARSKTWVISSPTGEIFTTKAMGDFCNQHGLAYSAFRNRARENSRSPLVKGPSKGWSLLSCA
jgi:hypothetical protein